MSALQLPIPVAGPRLGPPRLRLVADDRRRSAPDPDPDGSDPTARSIGLAPTTRAQALRRQLVVAVGLLAAVLIGLEAAGDATGVAGEPTPVATATVVVEPGETVWDVAARTAPAGTSTASWAASIIEVNGLDGGDVGSWQVLVLPPG